MSQNLNEVDFEKMGNLMLALKIKIANTIIRTTL